MTYVSFLAASNSSYTVVLAPTRRGGRTLFEASPFLTRTVSSNGSQRLSINRLVILYLKIAVDIHGMSKWTPRGKSSWRGPETIVPNRSMASASLVLPPRYAPTTSSHADGGRRSDFLVLILCFPIPGHARCTELRFNVRPAIGRQGW